MKVYILMGHGPVGAYLDRGLALYDAWLMTEGERYDENPIDYYVVSVDMTEDLMDEGALVTHKERLA